MVLSIFCFSGSANSQRIHKLKFCTMLGWQQVREELTNRGFTEGPFMGVGWGKVVQEKGWPIHDLGLLSWKICPLCVEHVKHTIIIWLPALTGLQLYPGMTLKKDLQGEDFCFTVLSYKAFGVQAFRGILFWRRFQWMCVSNLSKTGSGAFSSSEGIFQVWQL